MASKPDLSERLAFLNDEMADCGREISDLENDLKDLKRRLRMLSVMRSELRPCSRCNGHGELTEWDGEDSHFVDCDVCHGSGIKPKSGK